MQSPVPELTEIRDKWQDIVDHFEDIDDPDVQDRVQYTLALEFLDDLDELSDAILG